MNGIVDVEAQIFTECKAAILSKTPTAVCKSAEEERPSQFPFVSIVETSNTNYLPAADSASKENMAALMYTLNFYDNAVSGKKANVKKMVDSASEYFDSVGFNRTFCQPVTNLNDPNVYRMTARFEAGIDKNKHTYKI